MRRHLFVFVLGVAISLGWQVLAQPQGPAPAQIQAAIRGLLASNRTITGNWTCSGTCSGFGGAGGTVTSVSFTGGLISVATPTTTPALTVAGTSGGVPYFSSATGWASSAALTQYGVIYGGGAGNPPVSTSADTTTTHALFATATAPAFRALMAGDIPSLSGTYCALTGCALTGDVTITKAASVNETQLSVTDSTTSGGILLIPSNNAIGVAIKGTGVNGLTVDAAGSSGLFITNASGIKFHPTNNNNSVFFSPTTQIAISGNAWGWASSASDPTSAQDTALCRDAAGVVNVSTSACGTIGTMKASYQTHTGTAGATHAACSVAVTAITVTDGIITAITCS